MKKRIILFLTFLLTTMFLTGCTLTTSYERIEAVNKVANEIATNGAGYKLPEGYNIKYPDPKDTGIIEIISTKKGENTVYAEYEITNNTAKLVSIRIDDNANYAYFSIVLILMIVVGVIGGMIGHYTKK